MSGGGFVDGRKTFICSEDDFEVRGYDEEEVMLAAEIHLRIKHGLEIVDEKVELQTEGEAF